MASSSIFKRRRGKKPVVEKSEASYDQWKFKSRFHQMQFEWMKAKGILPEIPFQMPDDECPEINAKIRKRKWEALTSPITRINASIIWEFYANTARLDPTIAPTYKSYVRGVEVDFSPKTIMKVLGLRAIHFDEPGYQERINDDPDYDENCW